MMRKRLFVILCPDISGEELDKQLSEIRKLSENTSDVSFAFGTFHFCPPAVHGCYLRVIHMAGRTPSIISV